MPRELNHRKDNLDYDFRLSIIPIKMKKIVLRRTQLTRPRTMELTLIHLVYSMQERNDIKAAARPIGSLHAGKRELENHWVVKFMYN